jgi:hypothetical protein
VRAVIVTNTKGVAVRVGTNVAVRVGVNVGDGTSEAVGVGAVEVGNGPRRDCDVSASAVPVLLAFLCVCMASGEVPEVIAYTTTIKPAQKRIASKICRWTRFSFNTLRLTQAALLALMRLQSWLWC